MGEAGGGVAVGGGAGSATPHFGLVSTKKMMNVPTEMIAMITGSVEVMASGKLSRMTAGMRPV